MDALFWDGRHARLGAVVLWVSPRRYLALMRQRARLHNRFFVRDFDRSRVGE
jgi:hypothetical protein